MSDTKFLVALDAAGNICVVDSDRKTYLETTVSVEMAVYLKDGEGVERQNEYKVYKPHSSTKIQVIFPFNGDWVIAEIEKSELMQIAMIGGS